MKKRALFLIVILWCLNLFAQNAVSDQHSGISRNPDARLILDHCAQAMGSPRDGLEVIAEGQTRHESSDSVSSVLIKTRGLEQFRLERRGAQTTELSIINRGSGQHHWQGQIVPMRRRTTAYFRADHLPALMCSDSRLGREMTITYVGMDVVVSRPVFHIKLNAIPQGKSEQADAIESLISEYHIFVDRDSFVVLKTSHYVFSPDAIENHSLWETLYSDYRVVDGTLMPFQVANRVSGQRFSTTVFGTITTGVAINDQEFREAKIK